MLPVIYQSSIHKKRVKELNPTMIFFFNLYFWVQVHLLFGQTIACQK